MNSVACSIEGCGKPSTARSWCSMHYRRWQRQGDTGGVAPQFVAGGTVCTVADCQKRAQARGLCPMHYQRWRLLGDIQADKPGRASHKGAVCAVEGCGQKRRHIDWCSSHYSQQKREGAARPFRYKWNPASDCPICGKPTAIERGYRRTCSANCAAILYRYGGAPEDPQCIHCGQAIPLVREGRRRRADVKQCARCRNDMRKHGMTVLQIAARDGESCRLCLDLVDMSLRAPDPMRASVDHVLPRALGGTNDSSNLQLAHLRCNVLKGARVA